MNPRTITFWVLYDYRLNQIVYQHQFKYKVALHNQGYLQRGTRVIIKMKGHYVPNRPDTTGAAK